MADSKQTDRPWLHGDGRHWEDGSAVREALERWRRASGATVAFLYEECDGSDGEEELIATAGEADSLEELEVVRLADGVDLRWVPNGEQPRAEGDEVERALLTSAVLLRRSRLRQREQAFQQNYRALAMEALYDVGLAIASTLNLEDLSQEILLRAVSLLDARRGALYLIAPDGDEYRLERAVGGSAANTVALDAEARGVLPSVLPGSDFQLASAIEVDGKPRGFIVVGDKESRIGVGPFVEGDERALSLFANQAAIALENASLHRQALEKERLEREMELAAEIQRGLLPNEMPRLGDFEVAGWNRPTRQVGGDYYGTMEMGNGGQMVVVADVTGKGMPAALLVSTLHSGLHLLLDSKEPAAEMLAKLNQHIYESTSANKFITVILLLVDAASGTIEFLNAGHNPGLLVCADGRVVELGPSGLPLGLMPGSTYSVDQLEIGDGDLLCLYSDGITECEAPDGEEFGEERLCEFLRQHATIDLAEIIRSLDGEVTQFADGQPQHDDQTVVLLRRSGD